MPKVETGRVHSCPYCNKSFKVINSLYSHTKSVHGIKYSKKETDVTDDKTDSLDLMIAGLRTKFMDGEISAEEYEKQVNRIKAVKESRKPKVPRCTLDVGKLDQNDYVESFFKGKSFNEWEALTADLCEGNHAKIFLKYFLGQIYIREDEDFVTKIDFLCDGEIVTDFYDSRVIASWYLLLMKGFQIAVINALNKSVPDIYRKEDEDKEIALQGRGQYEKLLFSMINSIGIKQKDTIEALLDKAISVLDKPLELV